MGKRILITGVSKGLGYAMSEGFIAQGHTVIGCARSSQSIEKMKNSFGTPNDFTTVDVANEQQVKDWAKEVLAKYDPPDIVINNAAIINYPAPLWEISSEEFSRLIDINIKGVVNIIRHFVPAMVQKQQGIIVNFSSGWGRSTSPEVAPYCASKWANRRFNSVFGARITCGDGSYSTESRDYSYRYVEYLLWRISSLLYISV